MINLLFLCFAVLGFAASLLVHLLTFSARYAPGMGQVWPLHLVSMLVFALMLIAQKLSGNSVSFSKSKKVQFADMFPFVPSWMHKILSVCFIYVIVNYGVFIVYAFRAEHDGKYSLANGQPVVTFHGKIIRHITQAEYDYHETRIARGFSGHWMVFCWFAVIGLYDLRLRESPLAGEDSGVLPQTSSLLPHSTRQYTDSPRLGLAVHSLLSRLASAVGFLGTPLSALGIVFFFHLKPGCWFVPVWFLSAIIGAVVAQVAFNARVPARCPACGGRAHSTKAMSRSDGGGTVYSCRDCGQEQLQR